MAAAVSEAGRGASGGRPAGSGITDPSYIFFRESTASDYQPTLTHPQARFSFSRLGEELHQQFPGIDSLHFDNADIISELTIPRLSGVEVVLNA